MEVATTPADLVGYIQLTEPVPASKPELVTSIKRTLCSPDLKNGKIPDVKVSTDCAGRVVFWRRREEIKFADQRSRYKERNTPKCLKKEGGR